MAGHMRFYDDGHMESSRETQVVFTTDTGLNLSLLGNTCMVGIQ